MTASKLQIVIFYCFSTVSQGRDRRNTESILYCPSGYSLQRSLRIFTLTTPWMIGANWSMISMSAGVVSKSSISSREKNTASDVYSIIYAKLNTLISFEIHRDIHTYLFPMHCLLPLLNATPHLSRSWPLSPSQRSGMNSCGLGKISSFSSTTGWIIDI